MTTTAVKGSGGVLTAQTAKVAAKPASVANPASAPVAKKPEPTPAVVVTVKGAQAPTPPTYTADAKTTSPATNTKAAATPPAAATKSTPAPAKAATPAPATPPKPTTPQPTATKSTPAPAKSATPATPAAPQQPASAKSSPAPAKAATPATPAKSPTPATKSTPAPAKAATPATQAKPATPKQPAATKSTPAPAQAATPATPATQAKPATPQQPSAAKSTPAAAKPATPASSAQPATPQPQAAANPNPVLSQAQSPADAPATDGSLYATGDGHVVVDIKASDSGYANKIYWSSDNWATRNYLGIDNQTASIDIGSFAKGTQIQFGIDNGQGDFFKSGPASANSDNFQHVQTSADASGLTVGFEDLRGGGDHDFNDAIVHVTGLSNTPVTPPNTKTPDPQANVVTPTKTSTPDPKASAPTPPKATTQTPAVSKPTKDNRSGLGDGTNPGNGAGKANSPNTGTQNPNQAKAPTTLAQVAANAKLAAIKSLAVQPTTAAKSGSTVIRKA